MSHPLDGVAPDLLAKQVLGRLPRRAVVGERLNDRVGARGWLAPPFARGRAIYARIGVPNPWDPDAKAVGTGLGDVAMPQQRQPAPHLSPPSGPKPPAPRAPGLPPGLPPGFANIPQASGRKEPSEGKPAPRIGDVRKVDPSELRPKDEQKTSRPVARPTAPNSGAFGPGAPKHAVVKLPVRPGVTVPGAEIEPGSPFAAAPARPSAPSSGASPRPMPSPPPASRPAPLGGPASAGAPPRPVGPPPSAPPWAPPPSPAAPPVPVAAPPAPVTSMPASPVAPPRPAVPVEEPAPAPKPAPPPVNRKPPGPSAGLDDLFGMGSGGDNTRIRLPKAEPAGEAKPRRPAVTSPEELAKMGLDRRPPPPKPPPVAPSATGRTEAKPTEPEPEE